ncbi:depupylase/deamidase Dop [Rothia sp. AR01]|uniref:Depupylase/deamidase Dop n=1 Tax=Rothia santali TaxID=2949643 RepID=A0A9X2HF51_9MICC|nr:depupylase/deamidase Dop [Rothia santali]MCP3424561.1 depupylase/deamidase Dop [Rothia santali]
MIFDRIIGAETEFGVTCPARPGANDTVLSTLVVDSFAAAGGPGGGGESGWDYETETPLRDARGFEMPEREAHASQMTHRGHVLTSEDIARELIEETPDTVNPAFWETAVMNRVLPNGARLYVDHAHPEYSAPEATNPWDAAAWDLAGDRIAAAAAAAIPRRYASTWPEPVLLYKNNTDNKSVSYGAHENYLVPRGLDFQRLAAGLLPFLATRQVVTGAGRAGIGASEVRPGFQISQRADFFERLIGLETTVRRPIVNTRDEPHADPDRYRRLHVITGDSNLAHTSAVLKYATAAAVLTLIEHDAAPRLDLADPVAAMRATSHDPTLRVRLELTDGRRLTALEIQREYAEAARAWAEEHDAAPSPTDARLFDLWFEVLDDLAEDPLLLADRLDWAAKYALVKGYEQRGIGPADPKIQALDLQYADLRPERSLYSKLVSLGRMRTLLEEDRIRAAVAEPPGDTRAYLRGRMIARWPEQIHSAGWEVLAVRDLATDRVHRWLMDDPRRLTRAEVEDVLAGAASAHAAATALGLETVA